MGSVRFYEIYPSLTVFPGIKIEGQRGYSHVHDIANKSYFDHSYLI